MGVPSSYFRIHIYDCDAIAIRPDQELLAKNIVANGNLGNEWVTVDIKEMGINVSENGFFVGVEWLPETKHESFSDTIVFSGNNYDTTYTRIYEGNGVVLGAVHEEYITSKYKSWYLDSLINGWKIIMPQDESLFFVPDTLMDGKEFILTPQNLFLTVSCINADIRYVKQKTDKTYKTAKTRKLNKVEKIKQDLFKYPQNSIQNLFNSLIKAFENGDIIYILKYLCVYKKGELDSVYNEITAENRKEIIPETEKEKILKELTFVLGELTKGELKDLGSFKYELTVNQLSYNLFLDNGLWKINPNTYKVIKL
jgi:hypothetical protein